LSSQIKHRRCFSATLVTITGWADTSVSRSAYTEVLAQPFPCVPGVAPGKRQFQAGNNLTVQQQKEESGDFSAFFMPDLEASQEWQQYLWTN